MDVGHFAEWLRRQGYQIVRTASSYWYNQGPRVYQAFPYHWTIQPDQSELREFLVGRRAVGLRYSAPITAPVGKVSYHTIYEGPYTLDCLSANARSKVRRGLKNCTVSPISMDQLAHEGWRLQADTLSRQGRTGSLDEAAWLRLCRAADGLPGFIAWGAAVEGRLAATILTAQIGDTCTMLFPQSDRAYFQQYVNNALAYQVSHTLLATPGVRRIFYGLHSLDAPPGVDEFKFRMGYTAAPVRQHVVFHPWLAPAFNPVSHAMITRLMRWRGESPGLAKVEGMLRFHLEGQRPVEQQQWPDALKRPAESLEGAQP